MQKSVSCVFCGNSHSSKYCDVYSTLDQRHNRVKEARLCFICLKTGHFSGNCKLKPECRFCSSTTHHTFLCAKLCKPVQNPIKSTPQNSTPNSNVSTDHNTVSNSIPLGPVSNTNIDNASNSISLIPETPTPSQIDINKVSSVVSSLSTTESVVLPTATVGISGGGSQSNTRAFFDSGAQRTFVQASIAESLNLPVVEEVSLNMSPFDSPVKQLKTKVVKVTVKMGKVKSTIRALVYDYLNTVIHCPGVSNAAKCLRANQIQLADCYDKDDIDQIGLVIGADNYSKFVGSKYKYHGVELYSSPSGYIIFGTLPTWSNPLRVPFEGDLVNLSHIVCSRVIVHAEMDSDVQNLWKFDTIGIKEDVYTPDENLAVQKFDSSIQYDDTQRCYTVNLPFRNDTRPPPNYRKALGQLLSSKRLFGSNPEFFSQYDNVISDYVEKGFIEPALNDSQGHYLPHHGVRKESLTTPLRIVFNASSQSSPDNFSLNQCLLTGPSLTKKLFDFLLNFRMEPFAVVADISKAFLRIGINQEHRKYTKFLWFEDSSNHLI